MRKVIFTTILFAAAGFCSLAHADILRCRDAGGKTLFTDTKCPDGTQVVATTPTPQACTTGECDRRRERDLQEARQRARAEKEELAAMTAERHRKEIADRQLDEARYEAEMRMQAYAGSQEPTVYPVYYPAVGYLARCGRHCLTPHPHRHGQANIGMAGNPVQQPVRVTPEPVRKAGTRPSRVADRVMAARVN